MDLKKTKWIEEKRKNWPEGSLERHLLLNYPGCKTLVEAVQKRRIEKQEQTATQAMVQGGASEVSGRVSDPGIIPDDESFSW